LLRVVTVLGRYAQDTATCFTDVPRHTPAPGDPWGQARAQAQEALTNAARFLSRSAVGRPAWPSVSSASALARQFDEAAAFLAVGRDLLHTHFALGPDGRVYRSPWAPALVSERVNRAQLAEIGALASPIAHHGAGLALAPVPSAPADQRRALNSACQWLWALRCSVQAACRQHPVPAADRDLLAAIPTGALPARPALPDADTIPGLCDSVITTAERLRHLAWQIAQQPPWVPALTVTSLRQAAETSTLTSHHCALLATALTERTPGAFPAATADLSATAQAARHAATAWYQAARALRQVTTDTRGLITPAAAEARDLAVWTGRLAYADPAWTPASGPSHPPRPPGELTPRPEDIPHVVAAIHHAADAMALLASTEHHQLRGAAEAGRILVPTRTLDEDYDIPRPYAPAPEEVTGPLAARYRDAALASRQATATLGRAASATGAPSRVLTAAREVTGTTSPAHLPLPAGEPSVDPSWEQAAARTGPLQDTLLALGITSSALLALGADLDHASQRLLIDAADHLPPAHNRPPAASLNKTAASAALLNYALATGHPQAARLLRQPRQAGSAELCPALEPEPRPGRGPGPEKDTKMQAAPTGKSTPQEAAGLQDAFEHSHKPARQAALEAHPRGSQYEPRFQIAAECNEMAADVVHETPETACAHLPSPRTSCPGPEPQPDVTRLNQPPSMRVRWRVPEAEHEVEAG
jgi:hypothetical protein